MAERYFPFDEGEGADSREDRWRIMGQHWLDTGVLADVWNKLEVYADSSGMQVKVKSGAAWITGQYYDSDAEQIKPIASNSTADPRIDLVVVRSNYVTNIMSVEVVQGAPAATPTVPPLTQSTGMWEIPLAQVTVDAGASTIAAGKVADEREQVATKGDRFDPGAVGLVPSSYPLGVTIGTVLTADGWPVTGTLTTFRGRTNRIWQEVVKADNSLAVVERYFRQGSYTSYGTNGWGAWQTVLNGGSVQSAKVAAAEATTSTTYTALATAGPVAAVTSGPSGAALVIVSARIVGAAAADSGIMSFAVSGATTRGESDSDALRLGGTELRRASAVAVVTGLTPGSNTFTARYKTTSGTATFAQREITVIPL